MCIQLNAVGAEPPGLLTPVLRSLGNVAAAGGDRALQQLLGQQAGAQGGGEAQGKQPQQQQQLLVPCLVACLAGGPGGVCKEAAWALSNIAGVPGR